MQWNLLILGGTTEANTFANQVVENGIRAIYSYAGRVNDPKAQPLPMRVGGFGGPRGLADFLEAEQITHVVDATHPFASKMSWNAYEACKIADRKLIALTRPAWEAVPGDNWQKVDGIVGAKKALDIPGKRVFLAIGRMNIADFTTKNQHHYLLRLVDQPEEEIPLSNHRIMIERGPFTVRQDTDLLRENRIDLIVSKNSGGTGAYAKIEAARILNLPVIMIDRPATPERMEVESPEAVLEWLDHQDTDLGV
ncbi:MAG: cobalt-precorrin-6A reductase [Rhizobiaceae bacterium]